MDELVRASAQRERRSSLQLGVILVAGGAALWLGTRSLFGGQLVWIAPGAVVLGIGFLVRGLRRSA